MISNVALYLAMRGLNNGQRMENPRTVQAASSAPLEFQERAESFIREAYLDDPILLQLTSAYNALSPTEKRSANWTAASIAFAKGDGMGALGLLVGDRPTGLLQRHARPVPSKRVIEPELEERFEPEQAAAMVQTMIQQGEHERLEFKSTLRWDLKMGVKSHAMVNEVLKTVCAFLNTWGGDLLIGVADSGTVLGIESDQFESVDRCGQFLAQLVKDRLGPEFIPYIRSYFVNLDGKTVLVVSCSKAKKWAVVDKDGFFVRNGNTTLKLELKQAIEFTDHRRAA